MPTVLKSGPYRIYFYSHEPNEPPHVHVDPDNHSCKFWLDPVSLARNLGFDAKELRKIESILAGNQQHLLEAWHDNFGH
ncbi:MAG: DUF4160 domain-containing protein [Deltaproteobacteria bacterium]|nr:DUF4160 domain-containing protein [Deltaproteobacteria bacterium]